MIRTPASESSFPFPRKAFAPTRRNHCEAGRLCISFLSRASRLSNASGIERAHVRITTEKLHVSNFVDRAVAFNRGRMQLTKCI